MFELLGTMTNGGRVRLKANSVEELRRRARYFSHGPDIIMHWAIYRPFVNGCPFHNATDEAYLVEHFNSPYWLNRGVKSVKEVGYDTHKR